MSDFKFISADEVRAAVRGEYAQVATAKDASACVPGCCAPRPALSLELGYSLADIEGLPEGANMGLGCGNPQVIAAIRPGETVLDLGAGGGFDSFLAWRQVGSAGRVIGVDMTPEMVSKARANAKELGATNVDFLLGEIEHIPVADGVVDIILSNCVINLSPDKPAVFREAFRVLKAGGRLAISDVVATAPIPERLATRVDFLTGCVAGAALVSDLKDMMRAAGFEDVMVVAKPESREVIAGWFPDSGAEDYVASANLIATKPGGDCGCASGCC